MKPNKQPNILPTAVHRAFETHSTNRAFGSFLGSTIITVPQTRRQDGAASPASTVLGDSD